MRASAVVCSEVLVVAIRTVRMASNLHFGWLPAAVKFALNVARNAGVQRWWERFNLQFRPRGRHLVGIAVQALNLQIHLTALQRSRLQELQRVRRRLLYPQDPPRHTLGSLAPLPAEAVVSGTYGHIMGLVTLMLLRHSLDRLSDEAPGRLAQLNPPAPRAFATLPAGGKPVCTIRRKQVFAPQTVTSLRGVGSRLFANRTRQIKTHLEKLHNIYLLIIKAACN